MVDKQTELPPNPFFKKPYYSAEYKAEGDEHSIVLKDSIELKKGCAGITLKLLGLFIMGYHIFKMGN